MDGDGADAKRFGGAILLIVAIVLALTLVMSKRKPAPAPAPVSIDLDALCAGSPYPSLAPGQFQTVAVDCSGA